MWSGVESTFVRRYICKWNCNVHLYVGTYMSGSGTIFVVLLTIHSTPLCDVEWSGTYVRTQVRMRVEWDHALLRIFLPKKNLMANL